eukprot:sb/3461809/
MHAPGTVPIQQQQQQQQRYHGGERRRNKQNRAGSNKRRTRSRSDSPGRRNRGGRSTGKRRRNKSPSHHHSSNKKSDNNTSDKPSQPTPSPTTTTILESSGETIKAEDTTTATNGDDIYRPPTPSHDIVHEEEEEGNKTPVYGEEAPRTPDYSAITPQVSQEEKESHSEETSPAATSKIISLKGVRSEGTEKSDDSANVKSLADILREQALKSMMGGKRKEPGSRERTPDFTVQTLAETHDMDRSTTDSRRLQRPFDNVDKSLFVAEDGGIDDFRYSGEDSEDEREVLSEPSAEPSLTFTINNKKSNEKKLLKMERRRLKQLRRAEKHERRERRESRKLRKLERQAAGEGGEDDLSNPGTPEQEEAECLKTPEKCDEFWFEDATTTIEPPVVLTEDTKQDTTEQTAEETVIKRKPKRKIVYNSETPAQQVFSAALRAVQQSANTSKQVKGLNPFASKPQREEPKVTGLNPFATKPQQEEPKTTNTTTVIRTKHVVDLKPVRANSAPPPITQPKPENKVAPKQPATSKRAVVKPRVVKKIKIKKALLTFTINNKKSNEKKLLKMERRRLKQLRRAEKHERRERRESRKLRKLERQAAGEGGEDDLSNPGTPEQEEAECLKTPEKCDEFCFEDATTTIEPPVVLTEDTKQDTTEQTAEETVIKRKPKRKIVYNSETPAQQVFSAALRAVQQSANTSKQVKGLNPFASKPQQEEPKVTRLNPFATKPQQEEPKTTNTTTVIRTKHVVDLKPVRANSAPPPITPPKPENKVAPKQPVTSKRAVVKPRVVKKIKIKKAVKPTPQLNTAPTTGATKSAVCNPIQQTTPSVPTPQSTTNTELDDFDRELELLNAALDAAPTSQTKRDDVSLLLEDEDDLLNEFDEILNVFVFYVLCAKSKVCCQSIGLTQFSRENCGQSIGSATSNRF